MLHTSNTLYYDIQMNRMLCAENECIYIAMHSDVCLAVRII
jgi:hypothetical protein